MNVILVSLLWVTWNAPVKMMGIGVEPTQPVSVCCDAPFSIISWHYELLDPLSSAIDCGDLDDPSNGQVTLTGTTLGSMATYECDSGFTLVGNQVRTCEDDGNWSGMDPGCAGML